MTQTCNFSFTGQRVLSKELFDSIKTGARKLGGPQGKPWWSPGATPHCWGVSCSSCPRPPSDVLRARRQVEAQSSSRVLQGEDGVETLGPWHLIPPICLHARPGPCSSSVGLTARRPQRRHRELCCSQTHMCIGGSAAFSSARLCHPGRWDLRALHQDICGVPRGHILQDPPVVLTPVAGSSPLTSPCVGRCRLCPLPGFVPLADDGSEPMLEAVLTGTFPVLPV